MSKITGELETNNKIIDFSVATEFNGLLKELSKHIIGQESLLSRLIIALLADGHLLVEGAPGLAKTKAIKTLGNFVEGSFQRIQFTPDLLPADITGTEIFKNQTYEFKFEGGPIFNNLILADEINRAPAKAQSALLEAMAERQVTVGKNTYKLPDLFLVMATQNPIEQHGTYPLPEAQLDRFLLHTFIDYPDVATEQKILKCVQLETKQNIDNASNTKHIITQDHVIKARRQILNIHISEPLENYLIHLVMATRKPEAYLDINKDYIEHGASPRATIALARCAQTIAWLDNRDYVIPEDIKYIFPDIIRHRIILSYLAEAENTNKDNCIQEIMNKVALP